MPEFGVEELGLPGVHVGPGAGRGVQPADKVVDALRALSQVHLQLYYCIILRSDEGMPDLKKGNI